MVDPNNVVVQQYIRRRMDVDAVEKELNEKKQKLKDAIKEQNRIEEQIKAIQSVGQIIGEILKQIDDDRFIVKSSSGARYVVGVKTKIDKSKCVVGARVALDQTTLTIVRVLPREVDPSVHNMQAEDAGNVGFGEIGGLNDQIRTLRETIELPLINPELFLRVGIKPPKGCLMYGPPGTGKTLIASHNQEYAKENQPCIIFMDEIDAIGGRRFSEGTSADREIQRTLMELLNQLDGFDDLGKVKIVMATNRPDVLDPALLRPGRLDRKVEIPLPNEAARLEILKIHSKSITVKGEVDFETIAKMSEDFNGADMRNICTEAGMFAIRQGREYVTEEDFTKATRKIKETKKMESKLDYTKV